MIRMNESCLGGKEPPILRSISEIGITFKRLHRNEEAEKILQNTMESQMKVLGPEYRDTRCTGFRLARVLRSQNHYQEAETLLRTLLKAKIYSSDDYHSHGLRIISSLGNCLARRGKYSDAESILRRSLEPSTRSIVDSRKNVGQHQITLNLARLLLEQGKYEESEEILREGLEHQAKTFGKE